MGVHKAFITSRLRPLEGYRPEEGVSDEHAPAAVLVPLIEREAGLSVLLTLRTAHLRRHAGQIALPGGRADPGELPWQTALREAQEEVGLDPALVEVAGLSDAFWTRTGYVITPVVGFVAPSLTVTPNPDEVAEVFEVPFEFLMDTANHQSTEREFPDGVTRQVWAMPYQGRHIWGVTAMMLRGLRERLYGEAQGGALAG
jgi:8-oxo-dGTP pyrophosphatase MutT (NUDIX family)